MERVSSMDKIPFSFIQCSSKYIKDLENNKKTIQEGALYFVLDTKQILLGKNSELVSMGKGSGIIYAIKDTDLNNLDSNVSFNLQDLEEEYQANYPQPNDLIFNKDGCFYRVLEIDNTQIKTLRLTVAGGGSGSVGGVGGASSITLSAHKDTPVAATIVYGETCILKYEFWITLDGQSAYSGEQEIIVNGISKGRKNIPTSTQENPYQEVDITQYLEPGNNYIQLKCSDVYGGYKILQFSRSVVKLEIDDSEITAKGTKKILLTTNSNFSYGFVPYGVAEKTVTLFLKKDNNLVKDMSDTFSDYGVKKVYSFSGLEYGIYTLDVIMTASVNEEKLSPISSSYVIMCTANAPNPNTEMHKPLLATYMPIAAELKDGETIATVPQGKQVSLGYMLNDPVKLTNTPVKLVVKQKTNAGIKDVIISEDRIINSQQYYVWDTRNYPEGEEILFSIRYTYIDQMTGDERTLNSQDWKIKVVKSDVSTDVVKSDLLLSLSAQGRANTEQIDKRSSWTFEDITTTFSNVNWVNDNNSGTGWLKDPDNNPILRLNGKSNALVNFYPFSFRNPDDPPEKLGYNLIKSGFTIELDFAIRDVNNQEAVALKCMDNEKVGFEVSSNKIRFVGRTGVEVFANFNENERVRATIVVESNEKTDQNEFVTSRLALIYLNGVMTAAKQYAPNETFAQAIPVGLQIGSSDCSIDIYNIRVYSRALSSREIVNNFIYNITNPVQQTEAYERNEIYDVSNNISYKELTDNNSIMTIIGPLPTYKGDKRGTVKDEEIADPTKEKVIVKYECLFDKTLSFEDYCQIDVQGTSSQYYIRKNWKIKCKSKHLIDQDQIQTKIFCMKADYADATGTHNTQHANYIHNLYEEKTPAQQDDPKCRTTIYGYPVIMFHQPTPEDSPIFIGKYNFNFDKGSEEVFGFTEDYDVECWEFCNNDSNACNFLGPVPLNWKDDFEPRYLAPFVINEGTEEELEISFDRIEELQDKTSLSIGEQEELKIQRREAIKRFKEMHDWVTSTATIEIIDNEVVPITEKDLDTPVEYNKVIYKKDNEAYRLAKFKAEFENYFDLHYCLIYYVYTFVNLMVDQRAKNMFLTYWGSTGKWQPWLYDNDTCFGINNSGEIKYLYYHEDTDKFEGLNVYNGANSALWNNFRESYPDKIQETYEKLRKEKISYNKYIERFITNGSDQWGENVYNEDIEYKYLQPLRDGNYDDKGNWVAKDNSHLPKIQGTGEEYLRYFIDKRLDYCDSKWFAGNFPDDFIELRINTPTVPEGGIKPNPNITVTPYNNMWTCVRYKSNGTNQFKRTDAGVAEEFTPLISDYEEDVEAGVVGGKFNDTEVGIYGASNLSSLGDLSACYCREIKVGKAIRLTELIGGSENSNYYNENLDTIELGANKLLKKLNLGNCVSLKNSLDLSSCPNIEEVYLFGTNYESVVLPASGHITTLHLPNTLKFFELRNQSSIKDFQIGQGDNKFESYRNLTDVIIDNCPTINTKQLALDLVSTLEQNNAEIENEENKKKLYMCFTNVNWTFDSADFLLSLLDNPYIGSIHPTEGGNTFDTMYITGTCHIKTVNGAEMLRIKEKYSKDLKITYDNLSADLSFYLGGDEKDAYYHYEYKVGDVVNEADFNSFKQIWVDGKGQDITSINDLLDYFTPTYSNGEIVSGICKAPVEIIRDLSTPIQIAPTQEVLNGGNGYNPVGRIIEAPKKASTAQYDYQFSGWAYSPGAAANEIILNNIEQNTVVYATFTKTIRKYSVYFYNDPLLEGKQPILSYVGDNMIEYGQGVPVLPPDPKYPIQSLEKDYSFVGWSPDPNKIEGETHCYAQYSYTAYAPVRLIERKIIEFNSNTLTTIGDYAFYNCAELEIVNTPFVLSIGQSSFEGCSVLDTLILLNNEQVCTLGINALKGTLIEQGNGNIYVADNMVEAYQNHSDWINYKNYIKSINELNILEVNE